jgi:SsrA-binding protein
MPSSTTNIVNKKAFFEYHISDKFVAGVQLTGTEIKSIRLAKVSLVDSYCLILNGEAFVKNMNISEYTHGNIHNHDPRRTRKLLLTKREIRKLDTKIKEKGFTLVVTRLFINERGFAKVEIAMAKGKKLYDKRESIKLKDSKRVQED